MEGGREDGGRKAWMFASNSRNGTLYKSPAVQSRGGKGFLGDRLLALSWDKLG